MPSVDPTTVKIRFEDSPTKVSFSPSGVWGGPNYQGQIIAHFYTESPAFPRNAQIQIDQHAKTVTEQSPPEEITMVRQVQATVVFGSPAAAVAIGTWLVQHGNSLNLQIQGIDPLIFTGNPNPPPPK